MLHCPSFHMWQVFSDVEETQIPKLQRFLHSNTLTRRYAAVRRAAEGLAAFCDSLEAYLSDDGGGEGGEAASARAQSRMAYERSSKELKAAVWGHMEALDQELGLQVLVPYSQLAGLLVPFPSPLASLSRPLAQPSCLSLQLFFKSLNGTSCVCIAIVSSLQSCCHRHF